MNNQKTILTAYTRKVLAAFLACADKEKEFMLKMKKEVMRRSIKKVMRIMFKEAPADSRVKRYDDELAEEIMFVVFSALHYAANNDDDGVNNALNTSKHRRKIIDQLLDHYLQDLPPASDIVNNRHLFLNEIMMIVELIIIDEMLREKNKQEEIMIKKNKQIHNWPTEEAEK